MANKDDNSLSQEEKDLIALQTDMLRDARGAANSGAELNHILTPILLEKAGYSATLAEKDVYNPKYLAAKKKVTDLRQKLAEKGERYGMNFLGDSISGYDLGSDKEIIEQMRANFNAAKAKLQEFEKNGDVYSVRKGDITGVTALPETDAERLRKENEQLLLERQNSALKGELPVNPALLSSLDQQEEDLRASLMQNLGTGYETSTPGIEALAKFGEKKQAILEASRRDDIAGAGSLANELGAFTQGVEGQHIAQPQSIVSTLFGESSNLVNTSQGFSAPLDYLQRDRMANDNLTGGQQAGLAAIGYGAQTGNPYVAGAGALAYLFLD